MWPYNVLCNSLARRKMHRYKTFRIIVALSLLLTQKHCITRSKSKKKSKEKKREKTKNTQSHKEDHTCINDSPRSHYLSKTSGMILFPLSHDCVVWLFLITKFPWSFPLIPHFPLINIHIRAGKLVESRFFSWLCCMIRNCLNSFPPYSSQTFDMGTWVGSLWENSQNWVLGTSCEWGEHV